MTTRLARAVALALIAVLAVGCGAVPTIAPREPAAEQATPEPTLPPESALAGVIEFGTGYDEDTLAIVKPNTKFRITASTIAYVAHLHGTADATELTLSLTRRASGGAETAIFTTIVAIASPDYDTFANSLDFPLLADHKPGTYVLRIIREGKVLAEGTFGLVK